MICVIETQGHGAFPRCSLCLYSFGPLWQPLYLHHLHFTFSDFEREDLVLAVEGDACFSLC